MTRLDNRQQKVVFLTPELVRDVDAARKAKGMTFQAFTLALLQGAVEEHKESLRSRRRRDDAQEPRRRPAIGLGIRDRMERERAERDEMAGPAPAVAQPPSVNVNVSSTPASGQLDLASMARVIAATPPSARRGALRKAGEIIARGSKTVEEAEELVKQLDAEIKRADDKPKTALERVREKWRKT